MTYETTIRFEAQNAEEMQMLVEMMRETFCNQETAKEISTKTSQLVDKA